MDSIFCIFFLAMRLPQFFEEALPGESRISRKSIETYSNKGVVTEESRNNHAPKAHVASGGF